MKTGIRTLVMLAAVFFVTGFSTSGADYNGTLRVYMTETVSRWSDNDGFSYDNALLDFATQTPISVADNSVYYSTIVWNSASAGYSNLLANNYAAIGVVFALDSTLKDAYDPYGKWYWAHNVEATAKGKPGMAGANTTSTGYTHTVFIEEGTASW